MKIAIVTDDGESISRHFGRAKNYLVLTVEDSKVAQQEIRAKPGHEHGPHGGAHEHVMGQPHGFDQASQDVHKSMAEVIADCQVLICGGMGRGAYESMKTFNIQPIVTELEFIPEALAAYLAGNLQDRTDLLH